MTALAYFACADEKNYYAFWATRRTACKPAVPCQRSFENRRSLLKMGREWNFFSRKKLIELLLHIFIQSLLFKLLKIDQKETFLAARPRKNDFQNRIFTPFLLVHRRLFLSWSRTACFPPEAIFSFFVTFSHLVRCSADK